MTLQRMRNGKLPRYTWPGAYPVYYVHKCCTTVCPECADWTIRNGDEEEEDFTAQVNYDEIVVCDQCGDRIESAYPVEGDDD